MYISQKIIHYTAIPVEVLRTTNTLLAAEGIMLSFNTGDINVVV